MCLASDPQPSVVTERLLLNTAMILHMITVKYQPFQQPGQWKSCPGTSSLFIFWKYVCVCVCMHAWFSVSE